MSTLEEMTWEDFISFPAGNIVRSAAGDLVAVNRGFYAELLSFANFRGREGESRYVCLTYNAVRLGKIFGSNMHSYVNFIVPKDTAGKHYHEKTREIFYNPSLVSTISIKLKDIDSGEEVEIGLSGQLIEFEGSKWFREIIVPERIAHSVYNPNDETTTVLVTATYEHGTQDMFYYEM